MWGWGGAHGGLFPGKQYPLRLAPENLRWQSAWGVAMVAADKPAAGADALLPVYLRLSQAERERQERLEKGGEKL